MEYAEGSKANTVSFSIYSTGISRDENNLDDYHHFVSTVQEVFQWVKMWYGIIFILYNILI
jgi:hypothetical protein